MGGGGNFVSTAWSDVKSGLGNVGSAASSSLNPLNVIKDPLNAVTNPIKQGLNGAKNFGQKLEVVADAAGIRKSNAHKAADSAAEAATAESAARTDAYNYAINDKNIDSLTQADIVKAYQAGGSSGDIAQYIAAARAGKGVYGVRRINQNQAQFNASNPGRAQTLGGGSLL